MTQELLKQSQYAVKCGKILNAKQLTDSEKYYEIELAGGEELKYEPGQFVMISIPGVGEAPISISSSPTSKGSFELVIRKAGMVTDALHKLGAGDTVGIRGAFGRGFPVNEMKGKDLLLIGGGCGTIPLRSLIKFAAFTRKDFGKATILLGSKNPQVMLFMNEYDSWKNADISLDYTVDQGDANWKGKVGLITALIPGITINPKNTYAVVVGPPIMYKFVIKELLKKNIPDNQIIVSLERHMKCGVGKCGHCQIGEYYCCQDGPVFTYEEIKDKQGAL